jgi:hypothetical protein
MAEESTALVPTVAAPQVPTVHLVARTPVEMQEAQADLASWLDRKLAIVEQEIKDLNAALNEAREHGWDTKTLTGQRNKAVDNEGFYFKLLDAVKAGCVIIPDFPIEVFAIRVSRGCPRGKSVALTYTHPTPYDEKPDILPTGEGEYVYPVPEVMRYDTTSQRPDGSKETWHRANPVGFRDVVFPLRAARPEVMNETAKKMALKIFDQIGICPAKRKADPLIIGQILSKGPEHNRKCVSFIIAWHLNLNDL